MVELKGLSAFPITPSDQEGRIDTANLRVLVRRIRDAKVDSLGLLGSTGSYPYFSRAERRRALEATVEEVAGKVPVVVGVGALRTSDAVKIAQDAKDIGASAGLLAAVSYQPLTEAEVYEHFVTVARESGLPICIYDNPGTTHFRFSLDLLRKLATEPGIVAVKAPGVPGEEIAANLASLRESVPSHFSVGYSGDWYTTAALIAGADAWYSVLGGILPEVCLRITRAVQSGNVEEARALDARLAPLWQLFREFASLRVVYGIAELLGLSRAAPPLPVQGLTVAAKDRLREVIAALPDDCVR